MPPTQKNVSRSSWWHGGYKFATTESRHSKAPGGTRPSTQMSGKQLCLDLPQHCAPWRTKTTRCRQAQAEAEPVTLATPGPRHCARALSTRGKWATALQVQRAGLLVRWDLSRPERGPQGTGV